MRVPLPGRDYFPARVLLRGAVRAASDTLRAERRGMGMRDGLTVLHAWPAALPAAPPAPVMGLRPAA